MKLLYTKYCAALVFFSLFISQTVSAQLTATMTSYSYVLCYGGNSGSATVTASGGQSPYTYQWSPSGGTNATANNLSAGSYTVQVTDALMATATATVYIAQPGPLNVSVSTTNAGCASLCNGTAQAIGSGGSGPYNYMWSPVFSSSQTLTNLCPGTYSVTFTDANGCTANATGTVTASITVVPNVTFYNSGCTNCTGMCTSAPSGGVSPYTYNWSNSATNDTISSLCPGSYTLTATDANGCTGTQSVTVGVQGMSLVTSTTNASCGNTSDGSATVTPIGGVPPYNYLWTPTGQTDSTATGLMGGHYTVVVTDNSGCSLSISDTVFAPGSVYAWVNTLASNCNSSSGTAIAYPNGGNPPYTFLWSNASTNDSITGVAPGYYSVTVTDNSGCTGSGSNYVYSTCDNIVNGYVYFDTNSNCVFDGTESPGNGYVSVSPGNYYDYPDATGYYEIHVPIPGNYTVTATPNYYSFSCPASGSFPASFSSTGDTVSGNFGKAVLQSVQDLSISVSSSVARPGFPMSYSITYHNAGTVPVIGVIITFTHDALLSNFSSAPLSTTYSSPTAMWSLGTLTPGQSGTIVITLDVATLQNGGLIGTLLQSTAQIDPVSGDATPWNNSSTNQRVIQGSYDPNLKEAWTPGMDAAGNVTLADTTITYTLHFQNTGTDTAFTIVVRDTLPAELNGLSVYPGPSNHAYAFDNHNGVLEFTFYNILLPDSNVNEPASHGYVQFTVNRNAMLPVGTVINNEADIYFDFNPPVTTNTISDTIINPLSATGISAFSFSLYPNPAQKNVIISPSRENYGTAYLVEILDVNGAVMYSVKSTGASMSIDVSLLSKGLYFCRVTDRDGAQSVQKLVVE
jgi:uncharacterized repeat protein (TIGR01451 family)